MGLKIAMLESLNWTNALVFLVTAGYVLDWWHRRSERRLSHIPTVTLSGWAAYLGPIRDMLYTKDIIQKGYDLYHQAGIFKYYTRGRWEVIITRPELIDEMRNAKDTDLSIAEAILEQLHLKYSFGARVNNDLYHVTIIKRQLTRSLSSCFPDVFDEIVDAFGDGLSNVYANEWTPVKIVPVVLNVVCRTSNRLFVGLPLCRDPDWIDLNINFTVDVVKTAAILDMFPTFLQPYVGSLISPQKQMLRRAGSRLAPIIKERQAKDAQLGKNWEGRPNDLISWILEEAKGEERLMDNMLIRFGVVNFAAIHTSSMSFSLALCHLAANPQYIPILREEVETAVAEHGFTYAAVKIMHKIDSFLREAQRFYGLSCLTMQRWVKNTSGFTFSNGITVPHGTIISVASRAIHHDDVNYDRADEFDPFRFADLRGDGGANFQMVNTDVNYVAFGHGRHACPGRFFASQELKTMLAYVVLNHDFKYEDGYESHLAPSMWMGQAIVPNPSAKLLFRKRN